MIQIVFENEHFVICDKQSGILSVPSRHEAQDSRKCLGTALQHHLGAQIFPVHRLDYEVSGLVIFAKNPDAHRVGNFWFEAKVLQKTYGALTSNQDFSHIPVNVKNSKTKIELNVEKRFEWESRILRGKKRAYESPLGKPSLTKANYVGLNIDRFLRWNLEPVTGRSHQLRFDLSRHGFPIVGDHLYGSQINLKPEAIALRAYKIDFLATMNFREWGLPQVIEVPVGF